jgi:hypothetical protein
VVLLNARVLRLDVLRPACDLNDTPAGIPIDEQKDNTRDLPCATGFIDLKAFLGALVMIGYDGPVRAEPFNADLRRLSAEEAVDQTAKAMKRAIEIVHQDRPAPLQTFGLAVGVYNLRTQVGKVC